LSFSGTIVIFLGITVQQDGQPSIKGHTIKSTPVHLATKYPASW
jgi:hypothetical protein